MVHYEFEQLIDHREHNLLVYAEKSGLTALRNATSIHVTGHTAQAMTPDGCLRYDAPSARLSRPRLSVLSENWLSRPHQRFKLHLTSLG